MSLSLKMMLKNLQNFTIKNRFGNKITVYLTSCVLQNYNMKRIDHDYLGDVQRFVLSTPVYKLKVDNETIIKELNSSVVRLSDNPLDSHFEDFKIDFQTSPKTKELCDTIDNIIIDKFSSTMNVQTA